jgi:hypothetical protein
MAGGMTRYVGGEGRTIFCGLPGGSMLTTVAGERTILLFFAWEGIRNKVLFTFIGPHFWLKDGILVIFINREYSCLYAAQWLALPACAGFGGKTSRRRIRYWGQSPRMWGRMWRPCAPGRGFSYLPI